MPAQPVPAGFHTVTPHLVVRGAAEAIEFYKRAFGAEEVRRARGPDERLMHAEITIGDSRLMLCDEFPEFGPVSSPQALKGTTVSLHIFVPDVDAAFQRAVAAGATELMPPMDAFWGDRYGKLKDPFGHEWSIATHLRDMTAEELAKATCAAFADMG